MLRPHRLMPFVGLISLSIASCGGTRSGAPSVFKSDDGRSQVSAPGGWSSASDLNEEADLQIADRRRNAFFIVLSEAKDDFDSTVTYRDHAKLTLDLLTENVQGARIARGPTDLQIGGRSAVQYEIHGTVKGLRIVYLHTTVDGATSFHQLLAWTTPSRLDDNRTTLEEIANSFAEAR